MTEGIFFFRKDDWVEVNNWPKGHRKARLAADKQKPFGNYTLAEARNKVAEFIARERVKSHDYDCFSILPLENEDLSESLTEEEKAELRKTEKGSKNKKEASEMPRTDGRVKCNSKGCHNYVKPPIEKCQPCRDKLLNAGLAIAREPRADQPEAAPTKSVLVIGTGAAATAALLAAAGPEALVDIGERQPVPPAPKPPVGAKTAYDKAAVIALFETGLEIPEVAAKTGLTLEQVRYAVKKTEAYKARKAKGGTKVPAQE